MRVASGTAEWRIDLGSLERETFEYEDLSTSETAEIGTTERRFAIGPTATEETQSYTCSSSSGSYECNHEAAAGSEFFLVTISAENVGSERVAVPSTWDTSIVTDNSQYEEGYCSGRDEYRGGGISPGIVREGAVLFEVDESTSSYELRIELTGDITANWTL